MNLIELFPVSQTLSASLSTAESFFDFLEQPWLQLDDDSTGSPRLLLGSESPGSPSQLRGYMENCDPNSRYNISWEPKDIDSHRLLKFFINYIAPANVDGGEYSVHIKYSFIHVSKTTKIPCVIKLSLYLIKKGVCFIRELPIENIIRLKNFKGAFKAWVTAENEKQENLLCRRLEENLL